MNFLNQPSKRISNPSITVETKEAQTSFHETVTGFNIKFQFLHGNHIYTYPYHKLLMVNTKPVTTLLLKIQQYKHIFKADSMYYDTIRHTLDIQQGTDALCSQNTHVQSHFREGPSIQQLSMMSFYCLKHVFFCHELVCLIEENKEARPLLAVLAGHERGRIRNKRGQQTEMAERCWQLWQ